MLFRFRLATSSPETFAIYQLGSRAEEGRRRLAVPMQRSLEVIREGAGVGDETAAVPLERAQTGRARLSEPRGHVVRDSLGFLVPSGANVGFDEITRPTGDRWIRSSIVLRQAFKKDDRFTRF